MPRRSPSALEMRLADGDAGIFHSVVVVDMQVALGRRSPCRSANGGKAVPAYGRRSRRPSKSCDVPVPSMLTETVTEVSLVLRETLPVRLGCCSAIRLSQNVQSRSISGGGRNIQKCRRDSRAIEAGTSLGARRAICNRRRPHLHRRSTGPVCGSCETGPAGRADRYFDDHDYYRSKGRQGGDGGRWPGEPRPDRDEGQCPQGAPPRQGRGHRRFRRRDRRCLHAAGTA